MDFLSCRRKNLSYLTFSTCSTIPSVDIVRYAIPRAKDLDIRLGNTVIILNIGTDRSEQTVQTQIRLLLMEQSDQGLLCLLFCLHLLNTILHCKIRLFQLWDNYGNYFRCPNFFNFLRYATKYRDSLLKINMNEKYYTDCCYSFLSTTVWLK